MTKKKGMFLLAALIWSIIGLNVGCTLAPQIQPQVSVKEEPSLSEDWFKVEVPPAEVQLEVQGATISGEVWTCFSPASSRAIAIENKELRKKLELMNTRMAILYKRYFHKNHPTWRLPETTK